MHHAAFQTSLEVQMFGGFSLRYGDNIIQIGKRQTAKTIRLLQMLLYAGTEGISKRRLMTDLFGQDAEGNTSNNLRVIMFNLRKLLAESGLPAEEYIRSENETYYFSSSFPVTVDALQFEALVRRGSTLPDEMKLSVYKEAVQLYKGSFLPMLLGEEWVTVADTHYRRAFVSCMEEIGRILISRREYEECLELCKYAVPLAPFEEIQAVEMECLLGLNDYNGAFELYEETSRLYYEELGILPTERIQALLEKISEEKQKSDTVDFQKIQSTLKEMVSEAGPYYCSYPSFVTAYRVVVRTMERTGQSIYLMMVTMHDEKHGTDEKRMTELSDRLVDAVRRSCRHSDMFTRYSKNQFLILLVGIREEECSIVSGRIDQQFRGSQNARLSFCINSVANLMMEGDNIHFL